MNITHITTSQRGIVYLLLTSQLIISCGWNETIQPAKRQEEIVLQKVVKEKDTVVDLFSELRVSRLVDETNKLNEASVTKSINTALSLISHPNSQEATSPPLTLQAKGGHQVAISEYTSQATVQENVQPPFRRSPLTLPIRKSSQINLQHLAKQDKKIQERMVQVVFPEQVKISKETGGVKNSISQGYVLIAEQGLKGGAPGMRLDVEKLISTIVSGYSMVGNPPSTAVINSWKPFFNELASALASMEIDFSPLRGPVALSHLDPGHMKNSFEAISSRATGRNVRLENYGNAYIDIMNQVRAQITQKQSLNIDPAQYPSSSYEVYLKPSSDIFSMMALSQEVQKV